MGNRVNGALERGFILHKFLSGKRTVTTQEIVEHFADHNIGIKLVTAQRYARIAEYHLPELQVIDGRKNV